MPFTRNWLSSGKRAARRAGVTRARVASARMCCERTALAVRPRHAVRSRILCYHSVGTPGWGVNDVTPARFERQLRLALADGWRFVPPSAIADGSAGPGTLAVTFDDGVASVLTGAAPILRELNIPFAVFVVSDWSDGNHAFGEGTILGWREVEALAAMGAEIGSHSVNHPNFRDLSPGEAAEQLEASRETIAARTGIDARSFAIPFGQSGNWTFAASEAAARTGYTTLYAQAEETRFPGTAPRTFVTRFDGDRIFRAALGGAFDRWEEWF